MRIYNSIDDNCRDIPTTMDVKVSEDKEPIVRLEFYCHGCPPIQFDIKNWNTGLKLIAMITHAMNDTLLAQD